MIWLLGQLKMLVQKSFRCWSDSTEANLYIQLGDKQKFADLMKEAIEKDPNNHILYFNLGVITAEQGDRAKARSYYESAIELDPSYAASYLNLAALILDGEPELVEKMNPGKFTCR